MFKRGDDPSIPIRDILTDYYCSEKLYINPKYYIEGIQKYSESVFNFNRNRILSQIQQMFDDE